MKEYSGLRNLREAGHHSVFCPKCGNSLHVVMNGFFHGELYFCPGENKVFKVGLSDITHKAGQDYIESCRMDVELEKVRYEVNAKNLKAVKEALKA